MASLVLTDLLADEYAAGAPLHRAGSLSRCGRWLVSYSSH